MDELKITLTLPLSMVQVIGSALENSPYKVAAPVLIELQKQINAQQQQSVGAQATAAANGSDQLGAF
jgi:hypothetical protein